MIRNMILGGLLTVGLLAASAGTASAQYVVRGGYPHGGHSHGGGYGRGNVFYPQPVVVAPPRPVIVSSGYPWGNFGSPYFAPGFGSPTFVSPRPYYGGGFPGYGYGGGFGTVGVGYSRPGFGVNLGFIIR